jgi:hypothetical protein
VARALIKTTEDGPTGHKNHKNHINCISTSPGSTEKRGSKKTKGQATPKSLPTCPTPTKCPTQEEKGKWEAQQQQNASWSCPNGYPPAKTNYTQSE